MSNSSYSAIAKTFHWLIAGLIVTQYLLAELGERAEEQDKILNQLALLANHKSIGMTILALAIVRLLYRWRQAPPALPASMARWQVMASKATHILLYGFLFALPITGWLMSSAKSYSVSWFNLFTFPDLIAPNEAWADWLKSSHELLGEALFVIALLHIGAALKHHFIDKDDVLKRMAGTASWALFVMTIVISLAVFGRFFVSAERAAQSEETAQTSISETDTPSTKSTLPMWNISYDDSYIEFSGDQAGAEFTGRWEKWSAEIQFDKNRLESARFYVVVKPASVSSNDKERDGYIRSEEFFHVEQYPEATYQADQFAVTENGFTAQGALRMKGLSHPVALSFQVQQEGEKKVLTGTTELDRLVWNIGTGDWRDTSWVGKTVEVNVRVVATPVSKPQ